ncbi:MAG: hypothetical protein ACLUVG_08525 [Phocaeicola vulgatus]
MRDVTLAYKFNEPLISKIGMSDAVSICKARNLFRITAKDCDIDPEAMEMNTSNGMAASTNGGYSILPLIGVYIGVSFSF